MTLVLCADTGFCAVLVTIVFVTFPACGKTAAAQLAAAAVAAAAVAAAARAPPVVVAVVHVAGAALQVPLAVGIEGWFAACPLVVTWLE